VSEGADPLSLPVEGSGAREDAERGVPGVTAADAGRGPATPGAELVALSSDGRLATALLLQAQALDGIRQAHAEMLRRLDDGGGGALRRSVEELHSTLENLEQMQRQTVSQLARARRRARRRTLLLAASLLVALGGVAWFVHAELDGVLGDLRAGADRAGLQESLATALERSHGERAGLSTALTGTERTVATLREELAAAEQSGEQLEAELHRTRDERNQHIGESTRLREQVLERDRRLEELTRSIGALREEQVVRAAAPDGRIVATEGNPGSLAVRATQALHGSGAAGAQVLEAVAVIDGALTGLLLRLAPATGDGAARVVTVERATLATDGGRAVLRLWGVRESDGQELRASEDLELPALAPEAWLALGVLPPAGYTPVPRVMAALDALLAPHGARVVRLRSFDGALLGELEVRLEDGQGVLLRTLKAASGEVLAVGPELVLRDGTITIEGDERPFFRGEFRLPLPGGDYGRWLSAIASPGP
jgi:hypothetical protein